MLPTERRIVEDRSGNAFRLDPIDCPTCGPAPKRELGRRGGAHHRYGLGVTSTIVRCGRCSLLFPDPLPVPLNPQALYSDPVAYFARHPEARRIPEYRALTRELLSRTSLAHPSILDVGSGRGDFVVAAKQEGVTNVVGLELSQAMIDYARSQHRVELKRATLEDYAATARQKFDAVVLNAIIEHVYNPDAFVASAASLLVPGGVLHIDTPRDPNLLTWIGNASNRARGQRVVFNLSPTWPPYHLFGFTPASLRALLKKHGFAIESVRVHNDPTIPTHGGAGDRLRSGIGTLILRVGNWTSTGSNMFVWARRS